jgi:hypothetical protein
VLVLVCLVAVSCQSGSSSARGNTRTSQIASVGARKTWCRAKPDAAWKEVFNGGLVTLSRQASLFPLALANDGRSFFAEIDAETYSGIVRIDATSNRYTEIKRFSDRVNDQASGSFDGRWLVWTEYHSLYDSDDFTVWSWDSHTGRSKQIGAAQRSKKRGFLPSAWQAVVALNGYATWEQGSGPNNLGDIHVVDLRTGRDRVVRSGHVGGSFLVNGPLVVWPESMKPGALTIMRTADVKTGRPVPTPPELRHVRGGLVPVTDGKAIAYATDNWKSLWWSPSLDVVPHRVFTAAKGDFIDNWVHLVGRYVSFTVWPRAYLADASRGRYIQINPGGDTHLGAKSLALGKPPKSKANRIADIIFLPLKSLPPIPPCK